LSSIVPLSINTSAWYLLTMTYTTSVIRAVPPGVSQLEEMLVIQLSSYYFGLNICLDVPLS
jgi:hypothetical protein